MTSATLPESPAHPIRIESVKIALQALSESNPGGAFEGRRIAGIVDLLEDDVYQALREMESEGIVTRIQPIREPVRESRWTLQGI